MLSPEQDLIREWSVQFGSELVSPRQVIERAFEHVPTYQAITNLLPTTSTHPHPDYLRRWLRANENRFLINEQNSTTYRFTRNGHRWQLRPVPAEILNQEHIAA